MITKEHPPRIPMPTRVHIKNPIFSITGDAGILPRISAAASKHIDAVLRNRRNKQGTL